MLDIYIYADATHFYAFSHSFGQIVIHPFWQRDILENNQSIKFMISYLSIWYDISLESF